MMNTFLWKLCLGVSYASLLYFFALAVVAMEVAWSSWVMR